MLGKIIKKGMVFSCFCVVCLFLISGCEDSEWKEVEQIKKNNQGNSVMSKQDEDTFLIEKITFNNPEKGVFICAVNEMGDVCTLAEDGIIKVHTKSGDMKYACSDCIDFTAFCYEESSVYAYDAVKSEIVCVNVETESKKTIVEDFFVEEVLRMEKVGDELYMLVVPKEYQSRAEKNEYVDYSECLFHVSLLDGSWEKILIDNIIAIYKAQNGLLYFYVYRDDTYMLCEYDTSTKKERVCYDVMKNYEVKYLSAFVYEQDVFVYSELNTPCIRAISMETGLEIFQSERIMLFSGNEMDYVRGNVVYFGYMVDGTENYLQSFYMPFP